MKINVVLAGIQPIVKYGLESLFANDTNYCFLDECKTIEELEFFANGRTADVLFVDVEAFKSDVVEMARMLKGGSRRSKVLLFSHCDKIEQLTWLIDYKIEGYLLKGTEVENFKKAFDCLVSGNTYIQPHLIPAINKALLERSKQKDIVKDLTKREIEVLKLVAMGCFNKEVADTLSISERTVKNHVSNIFKKIRVSDRTQAAVFAIKNGIINV